MAGLNYAPLPAQGQPNTMGTQPVQPGGAPPVTGGGQPQAATSGFDGSIQLLQRQNKDYAMSLMQQYNNEAESLEQQFISDEQFVSRRAALQAKYKNAYARREFASKQSAQSIERIRTAVAKGEMDARMGEQAVWKMVLEPEAYTAKYPKVDKPDDPTKPFTGARVRSSSALMSEFIASAADKRGLEWGEPKKTKVSLVDQYTAWRDQVGYDRLDPLHQKQLDQRWDMLMRSDKIYSTWFSDKKGKKPIAEVKALRLKSPIGKEMSKRLVQQSPRAVDSPLGASVRKTMVKQPQRQQPPSQEELKATGSRAAYEQGVKLGYWK